MGGCDNAADLLVVAGLALDGDVVPGLGRMAATPLIVGTAGGLGGGNRAGSSGVVKGGGVGAAAPPARSRTATASSRTVAGQPAASRSGKMGTMPGCLRRPSQVPQNAQS